MSTYIAPTNGNNRLSMWLAGFIIPPLIGSVVAWLSHTASRVATNSEHIAVMQSQMADTREQLKSINHKLDKVLERK